MVRFGEMEELTELMVDPEHQGEGIGRELLERIWPGDPTPDLGRIVVAAGAQADLSLYLDFGVMPVMGHWHMRVRTERFLERRAQEVDAREPGTHVLEPARAVEEWKRLEPQAIGHERPALHEFFARDRNCLATVGRRRPRDGPLLGLVARRDRSGRGGEAAGSGAGRAGGARPRGEDAGAG